MADTRAQVQDEVTVDPKTAEAVAKAADASLKDYDPEKVKANQRVVTDYTTGASVLVKDLPDDSPVLPDLKGQVEADADSKAASNKSTDASTRAVTETNTK